MTMHRTRTKEFHAREIDAAVRMSPRSHAASRSHRETS
jgi:hypothetical protein